MEISISWKVNFKAASAERVTSVAEVTALIQSALAEITPWIMGAEAREKIRERMGADARDEVKYADPVNEWPDPLGAGERPSVERATEIITEKENDPEPDFGFGFGLGLAPA